MRYPCQYRHVGCQCQLAVNSVDNRCGSCGALCLQEEDNLTLEQYQRQDEVRIRDLTAELEKLSKQVWHF